MSRRKDGRPSIPAFCNEKAQASEYMPRKHEARPNSGLDRDKNIICMYEWHYVCMYVRMQSAGHDCAA